MAKLIKHFNCCFVYVVDGQVRLNTYSDMSTFYINSEVTVRYIKD